MYKIRRGADQLISIDTSSEDLLSLLVDIQPSERTTVKFPDYEITIEKCSLEGQLRLVLVLGSPAVWELVSNTRAAVKLRHICHTDSSLG